MDSINKEQKENNFKALTGAEAVEKLKELGKSAPTCFFCTRIRKGKSFATRPMSVQEIDEDGNFWFLSAVDSKKNFELKADNAVQLLFQASTYSDYLSIYGKARIMKSKSRIKELWRPIMKAWFTEGENDPRISIIRVTPSDGYYWDTKHGRIVSMVKTAIGAVMGKTIDDSIQGSVEL